MISIVFTTYYKNNTLVEMLQSIFKQSYKNWELIVIDLSKDKYFEKWLDDSFSNNSYLKTFEKLKANIKVIKFEETDNYNNYINSLSCGDNDFVIFLKDNDIIANYLFEDIYDIGYSYSFVEMISSDYIPVFFDENEMPCINENLPQNSVKIETHSRINIGDFYFSLYNGFSQLRNFHKWKYHNSIIILKKNVLLNNRFLIFDDNKYNDLSFCIYSVFLQEAYILDVCYYKILLHNENIEMPKHYEELETYLDSTKFKKNRIYYTPKNRNYIV